MKKKKLSAFLALLLSAGLISACGNTAATNTDALTAPGETEASGQGALSSDGSTYTYTYAALNTPTTWNSHDTEIVEYITTYTEIPLWNLVLNDTADGYEWVDELAVGEPEDITAEYAGDEKWGVPADATEGYAWKITLNPDAKWEDGTPITADSYVYSMQQLLNPEMNNLNASAYYVEFPIKNAENYYKSGQGAIMTPVSDPDTGEFADYGEAPLYISFTQPSGAFWGYSGADYYSGSEEYYVNEAGEDLMTKYGNEDYVPVTDEVIADVNYMLMNFWGDSEVYDDNYLYMAFYEVEVPPTTFEDVGFFKTGDYELTVILYNPLTPYFFKYNAYNFYLVNEEKYEAGKTQTGDMIKTNYGTSVDTYMSSGPYKLVSFQADKEWHVTRNENWYGWTDGRHEGLYQTTDVVCQVVEDTATQELLFLQGGLDSLNLNAENLSKYQGSDYLVYQSSPYVYYFNINNDEESLREREEDGINKTILTYPDFRKGLSLSLDRSKFVAMQGYGKPLYGYISDAFVSDVDTGERYCDSAPAQEALKSFYGVSDTEEITGYDLETARECLVAGYEQALADGVVSETDSFVFDYPTWSNETSDVKEVNFVQDAIDAAVAGTALEGRITVNMMVSENYYDVLDSGEYDLCMNAWNGSASDPYGLMEYFVTDDASPQPYLGFNPETETLDVEINDTIETHTYYDWYQLLCKGEYSITDSDTRDEILASMELGLLSKYRDCPFWSASTATLLSQKIAYPTYEPVFEVDLGGVRSMTYNFTDAEWAAYCEENNYQLSY